MALEFKCIKKQTRFLDPRNNYQESFIESEIRFHPLTGKTARVAHFATFQGFTKPDLTAMIEATKKTCPFCPETLEKVTPKFPPDMIPEGRIRVGEAVVIPNLSPYDKHSALTVMTTEHHIPLVEFTTEQLTNAFNASFGYFERTAKGDPEAEYCLVNWNYMPYSGASQVHNHMQVYATSTPGNTHSDMLKASKAYKEEKGRNFWADFIEEEKKLGQRYIGEVGNTVWLTNYTPFGAVGDIIFIFPNRASSWDLTPEDFSDLIKGLQRVFKYYDSMGIFSFNLAFYPGPQNQEFFWTHGMISARISFNPAIGSGDIGTLRHLYNETFSMLWPEKQCEQIKPFFV